MTNAYSREELPAIGWRLLSCYTYEDPRSHMSFSSTALASMTRPQVVWSSTGPLLGFMEQREFQAECRPVRWSYYEGRALKDKRAKKAGTPHTPPTRGCRCGFAAYHTLPNLIQDIRTESPYYLANSQIINEIFQEGEIDCFPLMRADEIWRQYWWTPVGHPPPPSTILALAWGFGETIAYDTTFRSEFMSLAALCNEGEILGGTAEHHADLLGIPAMTIEEMKDYATYAGRSLAP